MANILFLAVENLRQYRRSPPLGESVLHLVYESAKSNNGLHPTADTLLLIFDNLAGRRVMPGVRLLMRVGLTIGLTRGRGGWRSGLIEASPAIAGGPDSVKAGGVWPGAG
jgi:hypothetical protein